MEENEEATVKEFGVKSNKSSEIYSNRRFARYVTNGSNKLSLFLHLVIVGRHPISTAR